MHELAPQSGFARGCIYMYDPEKRALCPAIKFGDMPKERLRAIKVSSVLAQFELVASAFSLKTPLREESLTEAGQRVTIIVSAIGQATRVGVFYLETCENFTDTVAPDPMPVYRAVHQCLCDCLNVK